MTLIEFPEQTVVIAKDQPEYLPMPAHRLAGDFEGCVTCCWTQCSKTDIMNPILETGRIQLGPFRSSPGGFEGAYQISFPGEARGICIIASNGFGWEHVSVSFGRGSTKTPSWDTMCKVKDLFWDEETTVMQIHPPRSKWVNYHPGCLHLWRPLHPTPPIPEPHWSMVGPLKDNPVTSASL